MLKVFGHRIGLDELEQLLARQNIRAYCLGQEDRLEIALDPESKEAIDARDVASLLGLNHSAIQVFRPVRIPLNSSGKVRLLGTGSTTPQLIFMDPALFRQSSYGLNAASKLELLLPQLQQLTQQHKRSCEPTLGFCAPSRRSREPLR